MTTAQHHPSVETEQPGSAAHDLRFYFDGVQIGVALLEREQAEVGKRVALNDIESQADQLLRALDRLELDAAKTDPYRV